MQTNSAFMLSLNCVNFSRQKLTQFYLLNNDQNTIKIAFLKGIRRLKDCFENILRGVKKYH